MNFESNFRPSIVRAKGILNQLEKMELSWVLDHPVRNNLTNFLPESTGSSHLGEAVTLGTRVQFSMKNILRALLTKSRRFR